MTSSAVPGASSVPDSHASNCPRDEPCSAFLGGKYSAQLRTISQFDRAHHRQETQAMGRQAEQMQNVTPQARNLPLCFAAELYLGRFECDAQLLVFLLCWPAHPCFRRAQTAAVERGINCMPSPSVRCATPWPARATRKAFSTMSGAKLSADEIRQWLVDPAAMTVKANAERKPPMKSYASLPKGDLDALVAYLQTLKVKK